MKKIKLKQGSLAWEKARTTRIGSSEVFDIVRYYATDDEIQNCGINAEKLREEIPYTTTWALYHKLKADGLYQMEVLEPEFAEYGHAVEPYGVRCLQKGRIKKLKPGEVYVSDRLIASLDVSGVAEEIDLVPFAFGEGTPGIGQRFVCEQKSMLPSKIKQGIPLKYIIQAQYQITMTKADFYILQVMVLKEDSPFIRGKVCQMSRKKRYEYLDSNMDVKLFYMKGNPHLAQLIKTCIDRFMDDVKNDIEPTPFIECDSKRNIIESIRLNTGYRGGRAVELDLTMFSEIKKEEADIENRKKAEMQRIVEIAKSNNAVVFSSPNGDTAKFAKDGKFLFKPMEVI